MESVDSGPRIWPLLWSGFIAPVLLVALKAAGHHAAGELAYWLAGVVWVAGLGLRLYRDERDAYPDG